MWLLVGGGVAMTGKGKVLYWLIPQPVAAAQAGGQPLPAATPPLSHTPPFTPLPQLGQVFAVS